MFVDDAQFDRLLRAALLEAARQDFPEEEMDGEPLEYSPAHRRWERRFWKDPFRYARKHCRPVWKRVARTAALIAFTLLLTAASIFTLFPSARAWITQIFAELQERYAAFSFSVQSTTAPDDFETLLSRYSLSYVPEGYELVEDFILSKSRILRYQNNEGNEFTMTIAVSNSDSIFLDNENHQTHFPVEVEVNGKPAKLLIAKTSEYINQLIWLDDTQSLAFYIIAPLSAEELFLIAEGLCT